MVKKLPSKHNIANMSKRGGEKVKYKNNKQRSVFISFHKKKNTSVPKQTLQVLILCVLVTMVLAAQFSGLYPYAYNYALCNDKPLEVRGNYYRTPSDEEYGIHMGSDYSHCYAGIPEGLQRDPSTKEGMRVAASQKKNSARLAEISDYTVYKPVGYEVLSYRQDDRGDRLDTNYSIVTASGVKFDVSETKKGSSYDYTGICYKPPTENWSGTIIGKDSKGREICKTNLSKFVSRYTAGIYIDKTAIILRTNNISEPQAKEEVAKIFSSMEPSRDE